ncbi:hypothetical protein PtA15_7A95 [Puccinia triticina]|nr:uncharacterized protein PtA15_7A95 [Puccinia triticina]WAQ86369.1 hypothetical protein PtA15_7A95 [Puccinia triticina]
MADRLVPSYRNLIAMAVIEAKLKLILKFNHKTVTKHLRAEVGRALILRECIMSVMLDPAVDTDVQTCLLKISEILFKPSDESVPVRIPEEKRPKSEAPMPVSTKIWIHAPSAPAIEPAQSAAPLPKIILKDHQHHLTNDTDPGASSPPAPSAPDVPLKLAAASIRKPKPPPKPEKFQASGMSIPNNKMCHLLLSKCRTSVELFNEPVDPVKYQIPTYCAVIGGQQSTQDLGTIKANLVADRYNSIGEFEADVRLMRKNCFTFNAPTTPVKVIGRDLEKAFDIAMVKVCKDAGLPPTAGSSSTPGDTRKGVEPSASSKRSRVG